MKTSNLHSIFWWISCLLLTGGLTAAAMAQAAPAKVEGKLIGPKGRGITQALIVLEGQDGSRSQVVSGWDGRFSFASVRPGKYRLHIHANGFQEESSSVEVAQGKGLNLTFSLQVQPLAHEVTVTATGSAERLHNVPGEVNIINREEIEGVQARTLDDLFRYQPGVEVEGSLRRTGQTVNIRGFDDERVLVLKDGARVSQYTSGHKGNLFLDVDQIEEIEIVRGPASALYGSGALGGVVSITTRQPSDLLGDGKSFGGSLHFGYSSAYNEWTASPRLFGATEGGFEWTFGYTARQSDGSADLAGQPSTLELANEDVDDFSGSLLIPLSGVDTLRFSANFYENNIPALTNLSNLNPSASTLVDRTTEQQSYSLRYDRRGSSWFDRGLQASLFVSSLDVNELRFSDSRDEQTDFRSWGVEVRNSVPINDSHRLTYGVEHFQDRQEGTRNGGPSLFFPEGEQKQTGLYLQDEISLADHRLTIVPGIRVDFFRSDSDSVDQADLSESRANPKIGATYEVLPELILSGNYAHGFRAPRFQELFITGTHFAFPLQGGGFFQAIFEPNLDLEPEKSQNSDFGIRYQGERVSLRASYWRSEVDDFIDLTPASTEVLPGGLILQRWQEQNLQNATLEGVEASAQWDIHPKLVGFVNYSNSRGNDDLTGQIVSSIPPEKLVAGVNWSPLADLQLGLRSRSYANLEESATGEPTAGYTIFDFQSSWRLPGLRNLRMQFNLDNFSDKAHVVPLFGMPGVGRDFRIGFTYAFER